MPNNFKTKDGLTIYLADSETPPECNFVGRENELRLCKAALGITADGANSTIP